MYTRFGWWLVGCSDPSRVGPLQPSESAELTASEPTSPHPTDDPDPRDSGYTLSVSAAATAATGATGDTGAPAQVDLDCLGNLPADPNHVLFRYTGVVTYVTGMAALLPPGVAVNDPIDGWYAFDPAAPLARPDGAELHQYIFDVVPDQFQLVVRFGATCMETRELDPVNFTAVIYVEDDFLGRDGHVVHARELSSSVEAFFNIEVSDPSNHFAGSALPLWPPDIALYSTHTFEFDAFSPYGAFGNVRGDLTSLSRPITLSREPDLDIELPWAP